MNSISDSWGFFPPFHFDALAWEQLSFFKKKKTNTKTNTQKQTNQKRNASQSTLELRTVLAGPIIIVSLACLHAFALFVFAESPLGLLCTTLNMKKS